MAQESSIKILEVSNVVPFVAPSDSATKLTEFALPLTFLDTFCFKFPPVQCLFFYKSDQTHHLMASTTVPNLKHSLSLTLQHYLPLAGTLTWPPNSPKPYLLFDPASAAVSFTVAESINTGNFNRLSDNHVVHVASSPRSLVPALRVDDESASILALQTTLFPGEGLCVGVSAHHAFLDGKSVAMFMRSWAHVSKFDNHRPLPPELTPFHDRSAVRDPTGRLDSLYLNRWLSKSDPSKGKVFAHWSESDSPSDDLVSCTFELTRGEIVGLKTLAMRADETLTVNDLTSFVVASAKIVTCMVKATSSRDKVSSCGDEYRRVYFVVGADYRSRLEPPVPDTYFGNCAGSHVGHVEARECLGGDGLVVVAAKIRCLVRGLNKGLLEGAEERLVKWGSLEPGSLVISITWSPKFRVYETDFGLGRPRKVEIASVHGKAISLVESSKDVGGIEVGLVLEKGEMDRFASLFMY